MFPFFAIVDKARIEQKHLSALMDVHPSLFTHIKHGRRQPSRHFMEQAQRALLTIGLRKDDGEVFDIDDLFVPHVDNPLSIMDKTLVTDEQAVAS